MIRALLILLMLAALPARAETVVAGLSQDNIAITARFEGSEILVFGAVKREAPATGAPLGVIITVQGPDVAYTIRRKERRFGIWINTTARVIDPAPSFYAVSTSGPLNQVLLPEEDEWHGVTLPRSGAADSDSFVAALVRLKSQDDLFQINEGTVSLAQETLFSTSIKLPANLTEGYYSARIFLTRGGEVVDMLQTPIDVRKVGLERWLYALAHEAALIYGLMALAVAVAAGWGASTLFRYIRT